MRYYRNYGAKNINLAPIDDLVKVLPTQEQTGEIVTFDSPFAGLPLKSCKVNIPVTQEGTGDPSLTNVRNFVGVDSLDFSATGFNLLSSATLRTNIYISQTTGEEIAYNNWSATGFLPMKTGVRYRLLRLIDGNYSITAANSIYWACYDSKYNYLSGGIGDGIMSNYNNVAYMRISSFTNLLFNKAIIVANENKDYFVTESDYIDGNGKIFNFGKTIYAGELDVLTGELKATHKLAIFDGSESWVKSSSYSGGYFLVNWVQNNSISRSTDHLQNIGTTVDNLTDYSAGANVCFFEYSLNYKVNGDLYPTVEDFKNFLSQNNLQLLYPLPTAEVINLGGMDISTLQGENNLFASVGETTVQYFKK